ncbi:MAG TPA: hypothetical protein VM802_07440 [Chitinophaga sp.]|uniref:hypothetical protein n=1 Tax=Chitinophaga sp. TaxID=1869181 RepID=UPI002D149ED8|nr:hypothetical protein [Chitinophaga sp.]HVI44685.1 hypothetical protein [Chitinophaga sp.]
MLKYILPVLCLLTCYMATSAQSTAPVGVGILTPRQKLDINGDAYVKDTLVVDGMTVSNSKIPLIGIGSSNEIVKILTRSGNVTSFNFLTYALTNIGGDGNNVTDFDTGIPISDFVLSIAGYTFDKKVGLTTDGKVPPVKIRLFQQNNTWHINLDYVGGKSAEGNGTWRVSILAVNKIISNMLSPVSVDLKGNNNGSAPASPTGI